eukprot:3240605-Pyramimonas_sp.AAC.1
MPEFGGGICAWKHPRASGEASQGLGWGAGRNGLRDGSCDSIERASGGAMRCDGVGRQRCNGGH